MSVGLEPRGSCYTFFVEPMVQGVTNFSDAWQGRRIETIVSNSLTSPSAQQQEIELTLGDRVLSVLVGAVLLFVPIVAGLFLRFLIATNSVYYHPPEVASGSPSSPPSVSPASAPSPTPPALSSPITPSAAPAAPPRRRPPPVQAATPQQLAQRKTQALATVDAITRLGSALPAAERTGAVGFDRVARTAWNRFYSIPPSVRDFNLDRTLQPYADIRPPMNLLNHCDFAGLSDEQKGELRSFLSSDKVTGNTPQSDAIKKLVSKFDHFFEQQRSVVAVDQEEENALKSLYATIINKLIDANANCIDQALVQVEECALLVVGFCNGASQGQSSQLVTLIAAALYTYRSNLVKTIMIRLYPNEVHMADFERRVTQQFAAELHLTGEIASVGPIYRTLVTNYSTKANRIMDAYRLEYQPLTYLLQQLRTYHGLLQPIRCAILSWVTNHFDLNATDQLTTDFTEKLSQDPANDFLTGGGNLSMSGLLFLLQEVGAITGGAP